MKKQIPFLILLGLLGSCISDEYQQAGYWQLAAFVLEPGGLDLDPDLGISFVNESETQAITRACNSPEQIDSANPLMFRIAGRAIRRWYPDSGNAPWTKPEPANFTQAAPKRDNFEGNEFYVPCSGFNVSVRRQAELFAGRGINMGALPLQETPRQLDTSACSTYFNPEPGDYKNVINFKVRPTIGDTYGRYYPVEGDWNEWEEYVVEAAELKWNCKRYKPGIVGEAEVQSAAGEEASETDDSWIRKEVYYLSNARLSNHNKGLGRNVSDYIVVEKTFERTNQTRAKSRQYDSLKDEITPAQQEIIDELQVQNEGISRKPNDVVEY